MKKPIETKTYVVEAVNKLNGHDVTLYLQTVNGIVLDYEYQQIYNGTVEEYLDHCNYKAVEIEERDISCKYRMEVIENDNIFA